MLAALCDISESCTMCGITGIIDLAGAMTRDDLARTATAMSDALVHRGPDMADVWVDEAAGIALGFRRLSIIDLSPAGAQPMISASGRTVVSYNGEIYNADALKAWLGPDCPALRGHSDTEVLLETAERFGAQAAVSACIGMFGLALWSRPTSELRLIRDRLGIKPLYWLHRPGKLFAFASELHALRRVAGLDWAIDQAALADYLRLAYVPAPRTIYAGVQQLEPGRILTFKADGEPDIASFWSLAEVAEEASAAPFLGDEAAACDQLEALLSDAVGRRMVADVPLGVFLSGGIDSSTVTALMQAQSAQPVKSFSIGFDVDAYNEADHADAVARHLGTDHERFEVTSREARDVIPDLPHIYDQPFADSSQIPTYLVSKLARQKVTVALSGDGGDEVFAGYNRHCQADMIERRLLNLGRPLRAGAKALIRGLSPRQWDRLASLLPAGQRPQHAGEKLHKIADVLAAPTGGVHLALTSLWQDPAQLIAAPVADPAPAVDTAARRPPLPDLMAEMIYADTLGYLPGDILTKVDRASMATSLEVRVPLLDHRVVAFAWSLPNTMKVRNGAGKWLLRQVLYRYVPPALVDRPKMGFGVPIDAWLRGPLRDWAEDLLAPAGLSHAGLNVAPIRQAWTEHLAGRRNYQYALWNVLMFRAWGKGV